MYSSILDVLFIQTGDLANIDLLTNTIKSHAMHNRGGGDDRCEVYILNCLWAVTSGFNRTIR